MKQKRLQEIHYRRCKGIIRAYIERGEEKMSLTDTIKTLQTALKKSQISPQNLQNIISEIEKEIVETHRNWYDYPDRQKRLGDLRKRLVIFL